MKLQLFGQIRLWELVVKNYTWKTAANHLCYSHIIKDLELPGPLKAL